MQTPSTRRAIIAAALGTMVAGCTPPALASTSPDAELIRLGQEFDQAVAQCLAAHQAWSAAHVRALDLIRAWPAGPDAGAAFEAAYRQTGAGEASERNDAAVGRCDELAEQIRAIRPTTLAGLAAHAKVARFNGTTVQQRQARRDDLDLETATLLDFLDLVEGLAS